MRHLSKWTPAIVAGVLLVFTGCGSNPVGTAEAQSADPPSITGVFVYPWFPETENWATKWTPTLGKYNSSDRTVIATHVRQMRYAGMDMAVASWWGQGSRTDSRIPALLDVTREITSPLKWTLYYEPEGYGNPTRAQIRSDLDYIKRYTSHGSYLQRDGKPVIFVWAGSDGCEMADRWEEAQDFHVVLKVFSGYRTCASQPDSWHQYGPASPRHTHLPNSYVISPGFYKFNETTPRLARDPARFRTDAIAMRDSGAKWKLVTSFNEWGEGTSVEPAAEWNSPSGNGVYLDILHDVLGGAAPAPAPTPTSTPTPTPPPTTDPVIAAAGDVAANSTSNLNDERTAEVVQRINPRWVLALGDLAYNSGTLNEFRTFYDPSWGRFKSITKPVPGNHEYGSPGARGYFDYFGALAGDRAKGFYSFDVGRWRVIALNSNGPSTCQTVPCGAGSEQERFLRAQAASSPGRCQLAYWHHPRWSTGDHRDNPTMQALWRAAVESGVDVVLSGHDHDFERTHPLNSTGARNDANGTVEFVVGTGGRDFRPFPLPMRSTTAARQNTVNGVLKMVLHDNSYDHSFEPVAGKSYVDVGSRACR